MNYEFPKIKTIDDILPHIEGWDEFIVADREWYKVVNYNVVKPHTFDMFGPDDIGGAIRRECRGIIFDYMGEIVSRPFHKFFNYGEREETRYFDVTLPHIITEKMDGSMVRPLVIRGNLHLGTKMGVTDIGRNAYKHLRDEQIEWLLDQYYAGYTPILEWVGPNNRIVVPYEQDELVLLAIRDNFTGKYLPVTNDIPFRVRDSHGTVSEIAGYVDKIRNDIGREGDVAHFSNGHMIKFKCEDYVRQHRAKEYVEQENNLIQVILANTIDDLLPLLSDADKEMALTVQEEFWDMVDKKKKHLHDIAKDAIAIGDRKKVAMGFAKELNPRDVKYAFAALNGKDIDEMLMGDITKGAFKKFRWLETKEWLNGKDD